VLNTPEPQAQLAKELASKRIVEMRNAEPGKIVA
jgi:hypothetical protein